MALTNLQLQAMVAATHTKTFGLASSSRSISETAAFSWTEGTGANQADKLYDQSLTILASATTSLDLSGSLLDAFGDALVFVKVKAIYVKADAGNTNNVLLTRPAANGLPFLSAAGDAIPIRPGGCALLVWPDLTAIPVTAATADLIDLTNSAAGTSEICRVVILGTSA